MKPEAPRSLLSLTWIKAAFNNNATALWWPSWWESVTADTILEEDHPMTIPSKFGSIRLVISEEKIFENVYDGRTDGRRTPSDGKSSPGL